MTDPGLLEYDAMMVQYVPGREERFQLMVDLALAVGGDEAVVLDAASGPGSFAARLLDRAPRASVVAADVDPTMLAMARRVASSFGGRMSVVELDLLRSQWSDVLGGAQFDAVVLTSATHYLEPDALTHVYRCAAGVLRAGGLLLNGDEVAVPTWCAELNRAANPAGAPAEAWGEWWSTVAAEPLRAGHHLHRVDDHLTALRAAGTRHCGVVWQRFESHLLVGST